MILHNIRHVRVTLFYLCEIQNVHKKINIKKCRQLHDTEQNLNVQKYTFPFWSYFDTKMVSVIQFQQHEE